MNYFKKSKKVKAIADDSRPKITIQIDYKTQVTVRSMEAFNSWKFRFPTAIIVG